VTNPPAAIERNVTANPIQNNIGASSLLKMDSPARRECAPYTLFLGS
jgi:hypothetical protein